MTINFKETLKKFGLKEWGLIVLVILIGLTVWQSIHWRNKYYKDTGVLETLVRIEQTGRKTAEATIREVDKQLKEEEKSRQKDRERYEKRIKNLEAANVTLTNENEEWKKKLKEATDDQLAKEIGKFIGYQEVVVFEIDRFKFSLTRIGGERSVSLFADGEVNLKKYNNEVEAKQMAEEGWKKERVSFTLSLEGWQKKWDAQTGELMDCRNTSTEKDKINRDLKRRIFWKNVESWGYRGGIIILSLKVLGVLK